MSSLITALERIFTCLQAQAPTMAAALQPGLTVAEQTAILAKYPFPLPTEVVELYQWRNGSPIATPCEFLPMHRLLPLAEAVEHYQFTLAALQDDDNAPDDLAGHWLPILVEDANFYLVIGNRADKSLAPVVYRNEYQDLVAEFDSLTSMMMAIADCWETGTYFLAGTADWPYIDSHDAKETTIWLKHQPQQQAEMTALLENRPAELLPDRLPRAYANLVYSQHPRAAAIVLQDLGQTTQPDLRHHLIGLLGDLTDPRALTKTLLLLQSDDDAECRLALLPLHAWVQRGANDERIVNALLAILHEVNVGSCHRATLLADLDLVAEMLGNLADRRAVEPLLQLLPMAGDDLNFLARQQQIVMALGKLGDDRAGEPLRAIAQTAASLLLRMAAAQALTMLGDSQGAVLFQQLTLEQFTGETI
jgi:hypothetical protein